MDAAVVIERIEQATPIDRTLTLQLEDASLAASFAYTPGQFVVLTDPAYDPKVRRAYSMSAADRGDGRLRITVRDMGDFGAYMYRLAEGTRLTARAPQGRFVLDVDDTTPLLMVAGGSGVTPFHAFVEALVDDEQAPPHTLLQSARVAKELLFRAAFEEQANRGPAFAYVPTVTREPPEAPWTGRRGRIDRELVAAHVADPMTVRFYTCGPGAFVKSMLAVADELGIPKEHRHREQWG